MLGYEDLAFEYFFQAGSPILRTATVCDSCLRVHGLGLSGLDLELEIRAAGQSRSAVRVAIFSAGDIDFDILFALRLFASSAACFRVRAAERAGHDLRLALEAAGVESSHATLFTVREEDRFTN